MNKNLLIIEKNPSGITGLKKAKEKNVNVIYMSENKYNNKLTREDFSYIDEFIKIDTSNINDLSKKCEEILRKKSIDGVMTFLEYRVLITAILSKKLKLPGNSLDIALKTRDKFLMRQVLEDAKVPVPLYKKVCSIKEAKKFANNLGFPNVIKPLNMSASRNVYRNNSMEQLETHYKLASTDFSIFGLKNENCLLIESYMDGQEYSIEGVTYNEKTTIICITKKIVTGVNTFVEMGHIVPAILDEKLENTIKKTVLSAIEAIGIKNGITHTELKVTSNGVKIVEIASRLGGDRIPEIVELAIGVDLWKASISIALNEEPDITPKKMKSAAILFITTNPGKIINIEGIDLVKNLDYIQELSIECKKGDYVNLLENNSNRLGELIIIGDTPEQVEKNGFEALKKIKINT